MIVDRRRVQRLSLRVGRSEEAPRAADTIREALRIATMPGDGRPGRLFVRRLDLGAIHLGDGASPIARRMEAYLRLLRLDAVPISDPRATAADVVIARDPIEPLVVALAHVAAGRRLTAWYWPRVHERLTAKRGAAEIASVVWTLLAEQRDAVAAVPAVVGAVLDGDRAAEVLAVIDPIVGERLARVMDVPLIPGPVVAVVAETIVPPRWRSVVREVIAKWAGAKRAAWLVTAAVKAAHPRISAARLAELVRVATAMPVLDRGRPQPHEAASLAEPATAAGPQADAEFEVPWRDDRRRLSQREPLSHDAAPPVSAGAAPSAPATARRDPPLPEATPSEPASAREAPTRWTLLERPQPTRYGGLYFLLRPLARLGLDKFITDHPELEELDFGIRVLERIADTLQIPPEDPIRIALKLPPLDPPVLAALHDQIEPWHAALSEWLDHHAQLDLPTVVQRDAAVLCSRTHLDVIFDMESTDVRIRKAALDIDPGWVRWLGRVVQFHYVYGGMLDV